MPRSNKFIPAVNVQASVTYTRRLVKISSEEDIQPPKWKCTVFQITEIRRDVVQRLTTNHRHFVHDKKFTVCPTVIKTQLIHPLHIDGIYPQRKIKVNISTFPVAPSATFRMTSDLEESASESRTRGM